MKTDTSALRRSGGMAAAAARRACRKPELSLFSGFCISVQPLGRRYWPDRSYAVVLSCGGGGEGASRASQQVGAGWPLEHPSLPVHTVTWYSRLSVDGVEALACRECPVAPTGPTQDPCLSLWRGQSRASIFTFAILPSPGCISVFFGNWDCLAAHPDPPASLCPLS